MELKKLLKQQGELLGICLVITASVLLRLIPHIPNVAPIGALALFSGAHAKSRKIYIIPFIALFISDLFLGFHEVMPFVYGAFAITICIGMLLKRNISPLRLLGSSLAASFLFFVVTNFGVWVMGDWYPKTVSGLVNAYALAIPFFRNSIIGDVVYSFCFFYGYRYMMTYLKNVGLTSRKYMGTTK